MKNISKTFIIIVVFFVAVASTIAAIQMSPYHKGESSDHFDGTRFLNKEPDHGILDHLRWLWEMETVEWPEWIDDPPQAAPEAKVAGNVMRVTYINHATVLIQIGGINILTDPIWSARAGPVSWLGSKRIRAAGVKMEDLPDIHIILISHDHYDHLDIPTLKSLTTDNRPVILAGLGMRRHLKDCSDVVELDWWEEYHHKSGTKITFVPSRHNSGRGIFDKNKTLWGGYVIEKSQKRLLFLGDTGFGEFLEELATRFDYFDLAILPIGNYEKRWFMKSEHMNPDDAVKAHEMLNVEQSVGIHYATFDEHPEQSIHAHERDLKEALKKHGIPESRFWILEFGEGRELSTQPQGIRPEIKKG